MRLLRSWPKRIPTGRNYVIDDLSRVEIQNCDYTPLRDYAGEDLLLLEWDIAVAQEDIRTFALRAAKTPDDVLVAPYRIYADTYRLPRDMWAHRHWAGEPRGMSYPLGARSVRTSDPYCELFGLGMVYLPTAVLSKWFADDWAAHFGDVEFSMWHYLTIKHSVPIAWEVHPVHLNCLAATVQKEID